MQDVQSSDPLIWPGMIWLMKVEKFILLWEVDCVMPVRNASVWLVLTVKIAFDPSITRMLNLPCLALSSWRTSIMSSSGGISILTGPDPSCVG
jgi:hypothetical protein